jgi:Ca-activated chloride channel family protein
MFTVAVVLAFAIESKRCHELVVWSSNEKSTLLKSIAGAYAPPDVERRCVRVFVERVPSGDAELALRRGEPINGRLPHVWSPAANTWALLLSQHRKELGLREIVPSARRNLIKSPLVIAMPEKLYNTLRQCRSEIGWTYILGLARDPRLCPLYSAQWGRFRLAKTDPNVSTSGLHALISTYNAGVGKTGPLTLEEIRRNEVRSFVEGVEDSVVHYGDSVGNFLETLYAEDQRGAALKYVSAIAVEEKQVFEYNRGPSSPCPPCPLPPTEKLVAIYPEEGTLVADHPYLILNADWVHSAQQKAALNFLEHLETEAIQQLFFKEGFRDDALRDGDANVLTAPYFDLNGPRQQVTLSPSAVLAEMQASWFDLRKRANILLVFDVAESMNREIADQRVTKLKLVKSAISDALKKLNLEDAVGLWTFSTRPEEPHMDVVPVEQLASSDAVTRAVAGLEAGTGGRQLYATVRASVDHLRSRFATDRINAVVVLSNGDDDRPGGSEFVALLAYLRDQPEDERIRVFTIAYDELAHGALARIALASKGRSYDAIDPLDIIRVLREVISNF